MKLTTEIKELRQAIADYIYSEGCSCCRDIETHEKAQAKIGKMLKVKKYSDGSGYDFYQYRSNKND